MELKKKVILSFDYELFFGDKSGTVEKTLIEPTNQLLDCMDSVGFKGNFFVDWQMLKYLKGEKTERTIADYNLIVAQLKDIVKRGHRIELHIHPHWINAKYNGDGTWDFGNFSHYSLNSFSGEEVTEMFVEGTNLLENIAREEIPDYKIIAFRAGGWSIQPFDKLREGFERCGIKVDSSVMTGIGIRTPYYNCSFADVKIPKSGYYYFNKDVCSYNDEGAFLEVPISSGERTFWVKVAGKLSQRGKKDFSPKTDGTHLRSKEAPDVWINPNRVSVFTFSIKTPLEILAYELTSAETDITCYIEHPKDFTRYSVEGIKSLSFIRKSILYTDIIKNLNL